MTSAFEAEMNGSAPTFNIGAAPTPANASSSSSTANAAASVKSKQPFSRSVSTARARPTPTNTTSHRSSSVVVASSRTAATPSVPVSTTNTVAPGSVSFAKTPVKTNNRSSITTGDKENVLGSVNKKFVTARRASHFAGKNKGKVYLLLTEGVRSRDCVCIGDIRDIRRGSYMDASADKRQQSATKARQAHTSSLVDTVTTVAEEDSAVDAAAAMEIEEDLIVRSGRQQQNQQFAQTLSPGPFSMLKSPVEY